MKEKKYKTFGKTRSLKLKDFHYRGPYIYFITSTTKNKRKTFLDYSFGKAVIQHLRGIKLRTDCKIYVYCLMPDHVHLLLSPSENGKDLSEIMQEIKGGSTKIFWESGGKGKLWQRGFYDHIVRKQEDLREIAIYILNNPVRKGLVDQCKDYPLCGMIDELPA